MSEVFPIISSASELIGSTGSVLIALSCWRLFKLRKGRLLLTAHVSSIAFFAVNSLYISLTLIAWLPYQWQDYAQKLYDFPIIWDIAAYLYFVGLTITILALTRWFSLQLPKQESSGKAS